MKRFILFVVIFQLSVMAFAQGPEKPSKLLAAARHCVKILSGLTRSLTAPTDASLIMGTISRKSNNKTAVETEQLALINSWRAENLNGTNKAKVNFRKYRINSALLLVQVAESQEVIYQALDYAILLGRLNSGFTPLQAQHIELISSIPFMRDDVLLRLFDLTNVPILFKNFNVEKIRLHLLAEGLGLNLIRHPLGSVGGSHVSSDGAKLVYLIHQLQHERGEVPEVTAAKPSVEVASGPRRVVSKFSARRGLSFGPEAVLQLLKKYGDVLSHDEVKLVMSLMSVVGVENPVPLLRKIDDEIQKQERD